MNIKMAINSQLSTNEPNKTQTNYANNQNRNRILDMEIFRRVISREGEGGEWGGKVHGLRSIIGRYKIDRGVLRKV